MNEALRIFLLEMDLSLDPQSASRDLLNQQPSQATVSLRDLLRPIQRSIKAAEVVAYPAAVRISVRFSVTHD